MFTQRNLEHQLFYSPKVYWRIFGGALVDLSTYDTQIYSLNIFKLRLLSMYYYSKYSACDMMIHTVQIKLLSTYRKGCPPPLPFIYQNGAAT
jgi:hypothetical protein